MDSTVTIANVADYRPFATALLYLQFPLHLHNADLQNTVLFL